MPGARMRRRFFLCASWLPAVTQRPGDHPRSARSADTGRFHMQRFTIGALGTLFAARMATGQVVGPPDYIVGSIPLPTAAQGDVAVVGTSIVVGQGSFGGGTESI